MSTPFSLRIFVADGDPDGLRIVERFNWIGKALAFPRALLTQQNQRRWASYRVAEDSPQSGVDSPHLAGDSHHLTTDSLHWPPELLSLAEPARKRTKLPAAEVEALVLRLCDARWLTSKELATLLSREAENLQSRILGCMVKKRLLELRFPDILNRPDQAYRAVDTAREGTA